MYIKQKAGYVAHVRPHVVEAGRTKFASDLSCKGHNSAPPEKEADLESLLGKVIRVHTSRLEVDPSIPETLSRDYAQSLASYEETAPAILARSAREMAQTYEENPGQAFSAFHGDLLAQTDRFQNIQVVHGTMLQTYLTILQDRPEEDYLFISEKGSTTCDRCDRLHGQLFRLRDLAGGGVIPPLHPNCRCSLVAVDRVGLWQYNGPNREELLRRLQNALAPMGGGVFILDPRFHSFGISPDTLTRLNLGLEMAILGVAPKLRGRYRELAILMDELGRNAGEALGEFGEETAATILKILNSSLTVLDAFFQRGQALWQNALEMMEENLLLGTVMAVDAFFFGIGSALVSELTNRVVAFWEEPGLITGLNLLTLGLVDAVYGAFFPEEAWSPEHIADIVGATGILSLFGLAKNTLTRRFRSVDDFARSALDDVARSAADDVLRSQIDDLIRRTGGQLTQSQIDDILRMPKDKRPDPSTYLRSSYIDSHLAQFQDGVTKITANSPHGTLGAPGGTYVLPSSLADDLIRQAGGDVLALEKLLGLDPGTLGSQPVRIDVRNPTGLRMPSGNEAGTNTQWLPGGYTNGAIAEAIIDPVSAGDYIVRTID